MPTTYYVSNNSTGNPLGSNSYDGLSPTVDGGGVGPWLTPEYGMANMGSGNILEIRGGTYTWTRPDAFTNIPSGTAEAWTIVRNYQSEVVTHEYGGSTNLGLLKFDTGTRSYQYISFEASVQDGMIFDMLDAAGKSQAIKYAGTTGRYATNPNKFLKFENLEVRNSVDSGLLGYYCTDIEIINCTVHDNGDSGGDHGAYINDPRTKVRGGRFYNNSGWGIHYWNTAHPDILIEDTVSYANGRGGIIAAGGATAAFTLQNNTAYDHTAGEGWGITTYGSSGAKLFHNTCHGNLYGLFIGTGSGGGNNANVSNNLSVGNITQDIYVYSSSSGVTCKDNYTTKSILNSGTSTTLTRNITGLSAANEFVDSTNATKASRNYRLKTGATAIDPSGVTTVGVGLDAKGTIRPQNSVPDPGMDEFIEDPPATPTSPGIDVVLSQTVTPGVLHSLNADANDQDGNIVTGYVLCAAGNAGFDFDPSGCTVTHKTS